MIVHPSILERHQSLDVTAEETARCIGVSLRTVRRKFAHHGLRKRDLYTSITNEELDRVLAELHHRYPNAGYKMILGHIRSRQLRIQKHRVLASLRRVDPEGMELRRLRLRTSRRRRYSVPAPNYLWHIDGNHKLIRWRIVIHGGIDGYSRLVVYLKAATNNKAQTMLQSFLSAVDLYGGNIMVARFMTRTRGINRHSHITGRSVHNQRIERLWRDVFDQVTDLFYTTFRRLEDEGWLNPDQDVDLFALHWSYMPQIQRHLQEFRSAWNCHSLRSEGNRTPLQLWSNRERDDLNRVILQWEDLQGQPAGVHVPELDLPRGLTEEELATRSSPDVPLSDALSVYMDTVLAVKQMLGESVFSLKKVKILQECKLYMCISDMHVVPLNRNYRHRNI
ncbi:hypothetical protein IRJ41_009739 [Triplophysa rosa]|uniref:Integrase core domain-containing protein n=1 Tax=Triplophysa rosa TaxID=992332 RepID=A0A9W8C960_TRIRA|nr:hypothetical protein IRJ41_009739 [Triplophysa rosa]